MCSHPPTTGCTDSSSAGLQLFFPDARREKCASCKPVCLLMLQLTTASIVRGRWHLATNGYIHDGAIVPTAMHASERWRVEILFLSFSIRQLCLLQMDAPKFHDVDDACLWKACNTRQNLIVTLVNLDLCGFVDHFFCARQASPNTDTHVCCSSVQSDPVLLWFQRSRQLVTISPRVPPFPHASRLILVRMCASRGSTFLSEPAEHWVACCVGVEDEVCEDQREY